MLWQELDEQREALPCQQDAKQGPGPCDGQRLRKQLADDAEAAGSDGGTHGQFMLAFGAAGQEQDGYIPTTDQQQRSNCTEEQIESWPKGPRVDLDNTAQGDMKFFG